MYTKPSTCQLWKFPGGKLSSYSNSFWSLLFLILFPQLLNSHSGLDNCLILQITTWSFRWHEGAYSRSCSQFFLHAALIFFPSASVCVSLSSLSLVCVPKHVWRPECSMPPVSVSFPWDRVLTKPGGRLMTSKPQPSSFLCSLQCQGFSHTPQYPGLYLGSGIQTQFLMLVPLSPPPSPILSYFLFGGHTLSLHISRSLLAFVCTSWNTVPSKDITQSLVVPEYPNLPHWPAATLCWTQGSMKANWVVQFVDLMLIRTTLHSSGQIRTLI